MAADFEEMKRIREEINKVLKERPELVEFQRRIEEELRKAGNNIVNRQAVLQNLFVEQRLKLRDAFEGLKNEVKNLNEAQKKLYKALKGEE